MQIKTKIVSCHTGDSKPVKQEVSGTVILTSPLVFPALIQKYIQILLFSVLPRNIRVGETSRRPPLRSSRDHGPGHDLPQTSNSDCVQVCDIYTLILSCHIENVVAVLNLKLWRELFCRWNSTFLLLLTR